MSTSPPISPPPAPPAQHHGATGVALIFIGAIALVTSFIKQGLVGLLFLPMLGLAFILWGLTSRNARLLIPGGILGGIWVGTLLTQTVYHQQSHDLAFMGGVILLAMAAGFLIIIPLERMISPQWARWEVVPGIVLGAMGAGLLIGPIRDVLATAGKFWPLALIVLGAIFLANNAQKKSP